MNVTEMTATYLTAHTLTETQEYKQIRTILSLATLNSFKSERLEIPNTVSLICHPRHEEPHKYVAICVN